MGYFTQSSSCLSAQALICLILQYVFIGSVFLGFQTVTFAMERHDLHGKRYCEIIFSKGTRLDVYTSIGLNDCPEALWSEISVQTVKQETGSFYVYLNGPRRFLVDGVKNTQFLSEKPKLFKHLMMRKAAFLHFKLRDILLGSVPYREHHVKRSTIWVFNKGTTVYELISPKAEVYVMQSYALSSMQQSEQDLKDLGSRLILPQGWQFKTGLLPQETELKTIHHEAIMIQDNMKNTYQKAPKDFL